MRLLWLKTLGLSLLLLRSSSLLLPLSHPPSLQFTPMLRSAVLSPLCPRLRRGKRRSTFAGTLGRGIHMQARGGGEEEGRAGDTCYQERIVVCGGGINGASIAYMLAKKGKRPLLIDREWEERGRHTFDHLDCVMGLIPSDWYRERYLENASTRTFSLHHAWQAELEALGLGYGGMSNATILEPITHTVSKMLFDKERALFLKLYNETDADPSEFFPSTEEICRRFPWLSPEFVFGAYYVNTQDTAKRASPRELRNSLLLAAIELGAEVRTENVTRVEVVDANTTQQKFRVVTDRSELLADKIVLAMGPWAKEACSQWFDIDIPLQTCIAYASVLRATPFDDPEDPCCVKTLVPWQKDADFPDDYELIVVPRNGSMTWLGDVADDVDPSTLTDPRKWAEHFELSAKHARALLSGAVDLIPSLRDAEIIHAGIKFSGLVKDRRPIMGDLPGLRGAYIITACAQVSIFVGPALCEALIQLMEGDVPSFINASHFDIRRLAEQEGRPLQEGMPLY